MGAKNLGTLPLLPFKQVRQRTVSGFARRYTDADIRWLADMDARHDQPSGPMIKKLCERAYRLFDQTEYARLALISVSHLYVLRQSKAYARLPLYQNTPQGLSYRPAAQAATEWATRFIRTDSVHQGDLDKRKGVYHINAVDEITQFQLVFTLEKISERYLIPALDYLLEAFPFMIRSFHSDNGSEYINQHVVKFLQKLLIEFTKSRARQTNDNALVESKNGSVVRKAFGYSHIPQHWAPLINDFNQQHLNSYINYHRPCFFTKVITDKKGKQRKTYPYQNMMTPYDKLKSLPNPLQYLKSALTFEILDMIAYHISDNQAAEQLQIARRALFNTILEQGQKSA